MNITFDYIDSDEKLIAFSREIASADWLAVDTEFMRERTYYAQLALIQVASENSFALIDVPALSSLAPLREVFTRESCLKIMHSASQDMEVLGQALGVMPTPLFDTQIAASFLGEADQIAYAAIVKQRIGIELDKDQTRTNWLQRPLSPAQLGYARADVLYLYELYEQLVSELESVGRLGWAQQESQSLAEKMRLGAEPELAWQRLKSLSRLSPAQQHIARDLARWREQQAQQRDLPREWVLNKQALSGIAKMQPDSLRQMEEVDGLNPKVMQRIGKQLLKVVEQVSADHYEPLVPAELDADQRGQAKRLMARLREIGEVQNIAPSLMANRSVIERLVAGERDFPILEGWRAQVAGDELLGMLNEWNVE
jgi:ribonuclease D